MDNQPGICFARTHSFEYLVKRNDNVIEFARGFSEPELQSQEGAGHRARDGNPASRDLGRIEFLRGDDHWTVSIAHACAAGEQRILAAYISIGMNANGSNVEFTASRSFIQGLDILKNMLKF